MARLVVTFDELPGLVGRDLGTSSPIQISQERIDLFARAANDDQWIHTDPVRAATGPFGTTIAHGFLTLSLVIPFWTELFDVEGVSSKVNYGLDRVRFTSPVAAGSHVAMHSEITDVQEIKGSMQITTSNKISVIGEERPALVCDFIARFYR